MTASKPKTTTDTCWADPLSRAERRILREKLASACKRFWLTSGPCWIEMADLHLDVAERAEVATS
jgi:hypothetical protein